MPKISIITTTYKHSDYIKETIESVLSQTFTNWELLIGDDSPDDETWHIIESYVNKYPNKIKAWHNFPNKGIIDNMNFLIERVSLESKYIAFLEGDDLFIAENLEKKIDIFNKYSDVKLVYNNLDFINKDGKIILKNFLKKSPFYLKNKKLSKKDFIKNETFYGSYSTLMIDKEVLQKERIINPTQDKLYSVSDWDLFFRISIKYNCYGIEESLTLYRRLESSVSRNNIKLFNDLEIQIKEYLKSSFIDKSLYDFKMSFISILKSVSYIENNEKIKSLSEFRKSLKYNLFSFPIYKIAIITFLILPSSLNKIILKKLIKRG
ncbi:MAG: glycosyltransferase [Candidatus Gracilibacteria bacterium]|nr:glycosyltransferase [Candidatus Gracilibacteria bacterium]